MAFDLVHYIDSSLHLTSWALRFHSHPAILGVRELFGVALTSLTFLAEGCFMKTDIDGDPPEQHYSPSPARAACGASPPARAPGAGTALASDAGLGSCWCWQNHAAGRMGCHDHEAGGLAFLRRGERTTRRASFPRSSQLSRVSMRAWASRLRSSGPGIPPNMNGC